jgi:hypothetical protein
MILRRFHLAPLPLLVAMATVGHRLHGLDDSSLASVMLYAVLSAVIYPALARATEPSIPRPRAAYGR